MTGHLLAWAALVVTPAAAFYALRRAAERFSRPRPRAGGTTPPDLARLTARLRRLDEESRKVQAQRDVPGRSTRLRTVGLAYDDTLCACCAAARKRTKRFRAGGTRRLSGRLPGPCRRAPTMGS